MRKKVGVCIILCLLLVLLATYAAAAVQTQPGQVVEYTVYLENSAKLAGFKVYLDYDTSVFSLASDGEEYLVTQGSFSTKGSIMANASSTGCSVLWYHTSNVTASGSLFTVTLNVAENAAAGTYPVTLRYEPNDTVNVEEELVSIALSGSDIEVRGQETVETAVISVSDVDGLAGETVHVPVYIETNPGFSGMALQVHEMSGATFVGAKKGALLRENETGTLTVNAGTRIINWSDSENTNGDGEVLVLEFLVSPDCSAGTYPMGLSLNGGLALNFVNCNSEAIPVRFKTGTLMVADYLLGDVDDDGIITGGDAVLMSRHIVGFETLSGKALKAADIDCDGSITAADCVKMARYLVGSITSFD